ncbi:MAG TPA: FecR family protein, partial [Vicinamibacterales bacterium]|nr:FecR family protein [Vicinamibacterales bacterium]
MTRLPLFALCLATVCLWGSPSHAQENVANQPPAHISVVDGTAILERDGRRDTELIAMPVLSGDRLRTQAGRVEVLFADGSALHLDDNTVVDFQSDEVVRLLEGRVRLNVAGPARDLSYRIDAPSAWVQISTPGEYRVAVLRDEEVELAVLRGSAELVNEQGRSYISAGERTFARVGSAPSPAYVFNSAAWDAFDRWSEA